MIKSIYEYEDVCVCWAQNIVILFHVFKLVLWTVDETVFICQDLEQVSVFLCGDFMLMKCRRQGGEQLINFLHFACLLNRVFAPYTFTIPQNKTTHYQTNDNFIVQVQLHQIQN